MISWSGDNDCVFVLFINHVDFLYLLPLIESEKERKNSRQGSQNAL